MGPPRALVPPMPSLVNLSSLIDDARWYELVRQHRWPDGVRCPRCEGASVARHGRGAYARDEDGDGFCEVHVNTMEGVWSLLRSWLRPHRGVSQEKLPAYLGFFQLVHDARCRGKALLGTLVTALVA